MIEEQLLQSVALITEKYESIYPRTGADFNIFKIVHIDADEVSICRILHELLSPKGSHHQGAAFLKLFLESVLQLTDVSDDELHTAKVYREYVITNDRRIDLFIQTVKRSIPIEVKIFAGDQPGQCRDYLLLAKNAKLCYLTPHGHSPGAESLLDAQPESIQCASFSSDILIWLEKCIAHTAKKNLVAITQILLQLILTIKGFTGQMEDGKAMDIEKLITSSESAMRSAVSIQCSLNAAKSALLRQVLEQVQSEMESRGYQKVISETDYADDDYWAIREYYNQRGGDSYPGISYLALSGVDADGKVDLWVRLEVGDCKEDSIAVGYCTASNSKPMDTPVLSDKEWMAIIHKEPRHDSFWWLYYSDVSVPGDDSPAFKNPNDAFYHLCEEKYRKQFAIACADRLIELMKAITPRSKEKV